MLRGSAVLYVFCMLFVIYLRCYSLLRSRVEHVHSKGLAHMDMKPPDTFFPGLGREQHTICAMKYADGERGPSFARTL